MALVMVPSQTATFESVSLHNTAHASSLFSTMRRFASAAGVAAMSTVLTRRISANVANPDPQSSLQAQVEAVFVGYDRTFIVSAMVAVAGMGLVFAFRMTSGTIVPASSTIGEEGDLAGQRSVSMAHRSSCVMFGMPICSPDLTHRSRDRSSPDRQGRFSERSASVASIGDGNTDKKNVFPSLPHPT